MNLLSLALLRRLLRFDRARPSLPGEHWAVLGSGLYLMTRQRQSGLGKLTSVLLGAALVARAVSGRDGPLAKLRQPREATRAGTRG